MASPSPLHELKAGMQLLVNGDQAITVDAELAARFAPGDSLAVVGEQLLHLPRQQREIARSAIDRAEAAFRQMGEVTAAQISEFFRLFAERLADDACWRRVLEVNRKDIASAQTRGRSTTRLEADEPMRQAMIAGLRGWAEADSVRGKVIERVEHPGWSAELVGAELGVVAFIFEGRPNVVADATGVLRGGNTVVFRIGRDALATARAIVELAVRPSLLSAGLPEAAVTLVDSSEHAAGWALFSDQRLALAVARGSGPAVDTLGGLAQSAGVPVSLHGTGGAWLVIDQGVTEAQVTQTVFDSLDRKVCNTLNTCCVVRGAAAQLIPAFLDGLRRAGERRKSTFKLHVTEAARPFLPDSLFQARIGVERADGVHEEPQAEVIELESLGREWEWENTPEVTLDVVESLDDAAARFNRYSPKFVACLLSESASQHERFFQRVNAPFVGDGFTRWVDGQYALKRPELGLSNWQNGRLFGRGGVLSGDSVFTVRTRVRGTSHGRPAQG